MRDEIRRFSGSEMSISSKFNQMQAARRDLIIKQQNSGIIGGLKGIQKLSGEKKLEGDENIMNRDRVFS